MMLKLLILAIAISAIHEVSAGQINLDRLTLNNTSVISSRSIIKKSFSVEECTENGAKCISCTELRICMKTGSSWWTSVDDCSLKGETCLVDSCTADANPDCSPVVDESYKFVCYMTGLFPHLTDCTKYNLCINDGDKVNPEPIELECRKGFAYDSETTLCNIKKEETEVCKDRTEDSCTRLGEIGAITDNPNMFYICLYITIDDKRQLTKQFFNCPENQKFVDGECKGPIPPLDLNPEGTCKILGKYMHADDCTKYMSCDTIDVPPMEISCDSGHYFDEWRNDCVKYKCTS